MPASANAAPPKPAYVTEISDDQTGLVINTGGDDQRLYDHSFALLIGEVNYAHLPRLISIPGEISDLTKALERQHFKAEVYFDLVSSDIMDVLDSFLKVHSTASNSRIVVYISAHGYSRDVGRPVGYILPIDAPDENASEADIVKTALPLSMFAAWAQEPDPRHMFFIFDACFSGAFFGYQPNLMDNGLTPNALPSTIVINGIAVKDGHLVFPSPEKDGIESSSYVQDSAARSYGRQFLAAGDATQTTPGKSVLAELLLGILDDKNQRVQSNADFWTTGSEIGQWISQNGQDISRALFGLQSPPRPVYGHLPFDAWYQQGDIVFSRNDLSHSPIVRNPADDAAWSVAEALSVPTSAVLAGGTQGSTQSPSDEVVAEAQEQRSAVAAAVRAAIPSPEAQLSGGEEAALQQYIDLLSNDDTKARRQARADLGHWIAQLNPAKQSLVTERLLGGLSAKSYRFQLGVAVALGIQKSQIAVFNMKSLVSELDAAGDAAHDRTLESNLQDARKVISAAEVISPAQ